MEATRDAVILLKLSKTEAELKKGVAYKKSVYFKGTNFRRY